MLLYQGVFRLRDLVRQTGSRRTNAQKALFAAAGRRSSGVGGLRLRPNRDFPVGLGRERQPPILQPPKFSVGLFGHFTPLERLTSVGNVAGECNAGKPGFGRSLTPTGAFAPAFLFLWRLISSCGLQEGLYRSAVLGHATC